MAIILTMERQFLRRLIQRIESRYPYRIYDEKIKHRHDFLQCVNWPQSDVNAEGGLCDMIDSGVEITRKTFLKHVDKMSLGDIEEGLGYVAHPSMGLHMASDHHVTYYRGVLHGERVYYFVQSAIEYVFRTPEEEQNTD